MLILIANPFDESLPDQLEKFGEVTYDKDRLDEAHIALVRSGTKCTKEWIDSAPNLKLIIRGGVGLDNIDIEYAESKGIEVHNTPLASGIAVAELAMGMMLAAASHIVQAHQGMEEGKFLKKQLKRKELYGKTLCLVGAGNIATELARRAQAFGMNIVAYRKSNKDHPYAEVKSSLSEALKDSEYVAINLPLTEETRGIIDKEAIESMKDGVIVVNTGRGDTVVAEDMARALESGKVGTYATDVWPSDPPPEDYPILDAPRTLMIPHLGSSTEENLLRIGDEMEDIIEDFIEGDQS